MMIRRSEPDIPATGVFPQRRLRRLRMTPQMRALVSETRLDLSDLVYPMFACPGSGVRKEVGSMPGIANLSVDLLVEECKRIADLGIPAVLFFGIPESKDERATGAWSEDGIVQQAIRAVKDSLGDRLLVMADTCLCEYTSHGHCGIVTDSGEIANDPSVESIVKTALSQARAGADVVAPSDMMDGRVGAIREALDAEGFSNIPIVSYAVKFASSFYGPFREAAGGAPQFGDRKSHQMDPASPAQAMAEARLDLAEGADVLMVKPAGAYLDIIRELKNSVDAPLAAYQVSGEYAMIRAAGLNGWIDEERVIWESALAIKRAGANFMLTYFAPRLAEMIAKR
jgi:porphobilinogen synthase